MSLSMLPPLSVDWDEALLDGIVNSTIIQFLFTGIYTFMLLQAIASPLRPQNRIISLILIALFIFIPVNLMAVWLICRSILLNHDATQNEMIRNLFATGSYAQTVANATLILAVIVADVLLAWRSYVLWERKWWMLLGYSTVFFGELAALPAFIALKINMGSEWNYRDIYFASSLGVTVTASVLIVYRIVYVSRQSNINLCRYHYTIKIFIESGILYTATILISGLLLIMQLSGMNTPGLIRATYYCNAILVPITGIAPTLITSRIATFQSNSTDSGCFHTVSRISLRPGKSEPEPTSSNTVPHTDWNGDDEWKVHSV